MMGYTLNMRSHGTCDSGTSNHPITRHSSRMIMERRELGGGWRGG